MKKIFTLLTLACLAATSTTVLAGGHGKGKFMNFFDTNQDGTVTIDEFNDSAKARFKRIDSNNDGNVSEDEFRTYIKSRRAERKQQHFAKMDTDKDGQLTKDEYIAYKQKKAERKFPNLRLAW